MFVNTLLVFHDASRFQILTLLPSKLSEEDLSCGAQQFRNW